MAHQIDSMFFAGKVPWHGLGVYVGDEEVTSDEAIVKAGLNWTVERQSIYVHDLADPTKNIEVPNQKALRRMDNGTVLSIMSDSYRPVQNVGKFSFFDEVVGKGKAAMYHTAMSLDGGRKVAILAKLPGDVRITVPGANNDVTEKFILLADSFDGSIAYTMMLTPVRVVCANTLNLALGQGAKTAFRLRHSRSIEGRVQDAQRALGFAVKQYDHFEEEANHLARTKFTDKQMKDLVVELFPADPKTQEASARTKSNRDDMFALFENGKGHGPVRGTAWAAINAVAEWTDHNRSTRRSQGRSEQESRTLSVLFGASQVMKQQAYNAIQRLAA